MGDPIAPATDAECAKLRRIVDEAPEIVADFHWAIPLLLARIAADARAAERKTIEAQVAEVRADATVRRLTGKLVALRAKIRRLQWDLYGCRTKSGPRCRTCGGPRHGSRTRCAACVEAARGSGST